MSNLKSFIETLYGGISKGQSLSLYPDFIKTEGQSNNDWKRSLVYLSKEELLSQAQGMIEKQKGLEKSAFYFGVIPTSVSPDKTGRVNTDLIIKYGEITCLFCDIDLGDWNSEKKTKDNENRGEGYHYLSETDYKDKVFSRFQNGLPPSAIVFSGGGYHCYWVLEKPLTSEEDKRKWSEVEKRLVEYLDSDTGVRDFARVLRMPESFNHKRGKEARVINLNEVRYNLREIERFLDNERGEHNPLEDMIDRKAIERDIRRKGIEGGDDIERINSQVRIADLASHFGLTLKEGSICCPFHDDKSPSAKLYPDNKLYCWTCGRVWDSFEFAKDKLGTQDYKEVFRFFRENYSEVMEKPQKREVESYGGQGENAATGNLESHFSGIDSLKSRFSNIRANLDKEGKFINIPKKIPTGETGIDSLIDGGFREGVYAIAGMPTAGKTSLCLGIAKRIAERGNRILIFSLEMQAQVLYKYVLAWNLDIPKIKLIDEELTIDEVDSVLEELERPLYKNLIITDKFRSGSEMLEETKRLNPDIVMIDYLQRIEPEKEDKRKGIREQTTNLSYYLVKGIANTLHTPVIAISSVSREIYQYGKNTERDKLTYFKESGDIEYSLLGGLVIERPDSKYFKPRSDGDFAGYEITKVKGRYLNGTDSKGRYKISLIDFDWRNGEISSRSESEARDYLDGVSSKGKNTRSKKNDATGGIPASYGADEILGG